MLHVCDYIEIHGCPMHYAGSRGKKIDILKIKYNTHLTNEQKDSLSFDI